jgi:hydroxymethylbilane synthase
LSIQQMLPAAGQGALAVQCAPHYSLSATVQAALHHTHTAVCVGLERGLVDKLGAQCQSPLAVYAHCHAGIWHIQARICGPQGQMLCQTHAQGTDPDQVSTSAYKDMVAQHAIDFLQQGWG